MQVFIVLQRPDRRGAENVDWRKSLHSTSYRPSNQNPA